mmetsp:Transcript_55581/g.143108  ORF Transcript_55581/g.143108 Transcript_55581/m.143108 type:complete len:665 (+) Transcript_55581:26-2020(+)
MACPDHQGHIGCHAEALAAAWACMREEGESDRQESAGGGGNSCAVMKGNSCPAQATPTCVMQEREEPSFDTLVISKFPTEKGLPVLPSALSASTLQGARRLSKQPSLTSKRSLRSTATVANLTSFADAGLLRATRLSRVMHDRGSILIDKTGSDDTYDMSETVGEIHTFLSHNWSTNRWDKFMVLILHFNWAPALVVSTATAMACSALTAVGLLPTVQTSLGRCGFVGIALSAPVFVLVLTYWHEVRRLFRCSDPLVFLDKTCIHQTDEDLKRRGIDKLCAFLSKSSWLLCCFTDRYLKQLWTIYELATFLLMHPLKRITLMPTYVPPTVIIGVAIAYVSSLTIFFLPPELESVRFVGTYLPCVWAYSALLRYSAHKRSHVRSSVQGFGIRSACCHCEEDRAVVESNVAEMLRYFNLVEESETDEAALDEFDRMVHTNLPRAVIRSLGRTGVPYRYQICISLLHSLPMSLGIYAADYHEGDRSLSHGILGLVQMTMHAVTTLPLAWALAVKVVERRLDAPRWLEVLIVLIGGVCAFCFASVIFRFDLWYLQPLARDCGGLGTVGLVVFDLMLLILTAMAYRGYKKRMAWVCGRGLRGASPALRRLSGISAATPKAMSPKGLPLRPDGEPAMRAASCNSDVEDDDVPTGVPADVENRRPSRTYSI